jgi:hypothetical protein
MKQEIITAQPNNYQVTLDNYVSIVEKTNDQLSHWVNISNGIISGLGVFIALIAIFVGYAIFRNSKEQREQSKEFFTNLENQYKEQVSIANKREEDAKVEFEKLIKDQQQKLKSANKENKEKIEKVINDLEKQKAIIGLHSEPVKVVYDSNFNLSSRLNLGKRSEIHSIFCIKCGKSFSYYEEDRKPWELSSTAFQNSIYGMNNKKVYCPHCGIENMI